MCAHICIYVYTCTHTCAYVYMCSICICLHIYVYTICFIYVCVYTHGVIQTWRRNLILSLMMSEATAHKYAWIICLNAHGLTHPQIHPHTPTNSYKGIYMQASTHAHSPIHIYYTHILLYSNFIVLLFLSLTKLTISLYLSTVKPS